MTWWWEQIHEKGLYWVWKSVSGFIDGTGFGSAGWGPLAIPATESLSAYAMTDGKTTLLWLLDKRYEYPSNAGVEAEAFAGGTALNLPLPKGRYEFGWYDTVTGKVIVEEKAATQGGGVTLQIPLFKEDIAVKIGRSR